jgi:hypothetical protein
VEYGRFPALRACRSGVTGSSPERAANHPLTIPFRTNDPIQEIQVIQPTWQWIKATVHWLAMEWRVWLALAVFPVVFIIGSWLPGSLEAHLRYCGLTFEVIGIFTVAFGLLDKWRLFKRPSILDHLRDWWERRPLWGGKGQTVALSGLESVAVVGSCKVSLWRGVPPGASVEDRLATLEENVKTLREEHGETGKHIEEGRFRV